MTLLAAFALFGCATPLHEGFYEDIHLGDTRQHLEEAYGIPYTIVASQRYPGSAVHIYRGGGDVCGASISEERINYIQCVKDDAYMSPTQKTLTVIGLMLGGYSDGFNQSRQSQTTTNCVSNRDPATGSYFTNCH